MVGLVKSYYFVKLDRLILLDSFISTTLLFLYFDHYKRIFYLKEEHNKFVMLIGSCFKLLLFFILFFFGRNLYQYIQFNHSHCGQGGIWEREGK